MRQTRKQRAKTLLERLTRGPHWTDIAITFTKEEAEGQYRRWAESWILHELTDLVPELRREKIEER